MAVKSIEEILSAVRTCIGEDTSNESIALLEDVTDTLNDLTTKATQSTGDYEKKYNELSAQYKQLDEDWRKRYTSRFYDKGVEPPPAPASEDDTDEPDVQINDLFKSKE